MNKSKKLIKFKFNKSNKSKKRKNERKNKNKAGKVIASGGFGCVFKPALLCKNKYFQ